MAQTFHHVKKNDQVVVIAGKERGKIGKVIQILPEKQRLIVEKVNMVKKHSRAGVQSQQGGIIEKEGTLHISNVMLICHKCNIGVRTGDRVLEDGKKVRVCKKCGEMLDK